MSQKYPVGNALVPYGTPTHATELFLQLLKITFAEFPKDHPLRYDEENFDSSGIAFDVVLNRDSKLLGKKTIVVISRGAQSSNPTIIGDLGHVQLPNNLKWGSNLVQSSIDIQVVSRAKGEVEIVSQHIFGVMMMLRPRWPAILGIHMVMGMNMSDVQRMDDDDATFIARGGLQFTQQYIWSQATDDPLLRSIGLTLSELDSKTLAK